MLSAKHDMVKTQHTSCNKYSNQVGGERAKKCYLDDSTQMECFHEIDMNKLLWL